MSEPAAGLCPHGRPWGLCETCALAGRDATIAHLRGELDVRSQELRAAHDRAVSWAVGGREQERAFAVLREKLAVARAALETIEHHASETKIAREARDTLRALDAAAEKKTP